MSDTLNERIVLGGFALCFLAGSARAQSIATIIDASDTLPGGLGHLGFVAGMAVDDSGHVLVSVRTDNPNQNFNGAILDENGNVLAAEGDAVSQPTGASILGFAQEIVVSAAGSSTYLLRLSGITGNATDDFLYRNTPPDFVLREGDACTAPQVTAGSSIVIFLAPVTNDSGLICFHGTLDDPNIPGTFNTKALFVVDPTGGTQSVPYKVGDVLPGQSFAINDFEWDFHGLTFNNSNQILFGAATAGPAGQNAVLYRNGTKIAQTSDPSPFGPAYISLASSTLCSHMNNAGKCVFACGLSGGTHGIVADGTAFVQEGDEIPSIEPFAISEFGQPVFIGDDGRVLWYGVWNLPGGSQAGGLFADYTLLVEQGATLIDNHLVTALPALDRSYTMSPSGQYVVFKATLDSVGEGAFLINLWQ